MLLDLLLGVEEHVIFSVHLIGLGAAMFGVIFFRRSGYKGLFAKVITWGGLSVATISIAWFYTLLATQTP